MLGEGLIVLVGRRIGRGFYTVAEGYRAPYFFERDSGCVCYGWPLIRIQRTEIVRVLLKET